jgi:FkbM family methyltransferase
MNDATGVIEVFPAALSDFDGHVSLVTDANRAVTRTCRDITGTVPCHRLDTLFSFAGKFVVCKIDVEGHELEVVGGMAEIIRSNRVLLQVEIHGTRSEATLTNLKKQGFDLLGMVHPHDYFLIKE